MNKRLAIFLPAVLLVGCTSGKEGYDAHSGVPDGAKVTMATDPDITADTRYAAGQMAEGSNRPEMAIAQYEKALETDPKHAASLYRLGVLHAQRQEYPAAIEAWKKYIKATNDSAAGWGNLGFCYELMADPEHAEAAYKKGIEREAKSQICRVNYGLMLARLGHANEAIAQFEAVLSPSAAHYNVGSVYEQQKKFAQAKMEYTRSLELDPTFFDAQQRLASLGE